MRREWEAGETFRSPAPGENGHHDLFSLYPFLVIESPVLAVQMATEMIVYILPFPSQ